MFPPRQNAMLSARLQTLERHLQRLFEEQLSRLLPGEEARAALHRQILNGLHAALRHAPDKAPSKVYISLPPALSQAYQQNPALHSALEHLVQRAMQQSGLPCEHPPKIEILTDATLPGNEVQFSIPETGPLSETEAYPSLPDSIPWPEVNAGEAFLIVGGKETYLLKQVITNIGRRPDNHLVINDPRVSRQHAQIRAEKGRYYLFDLNATGGTFVNGQRIRQHLLKAGDVISLAGFPLVFGIERDTSLDQTQEYHPPAS